MTRLVGLVGAPLLPYVLIADKGIHGWGKPRPPHFLDQEPGLSPVFTAYDIAIHSGRNTRA